MKIMINRTQHILRLLGNISGTIAKWLIAVILLYLGATETDIGNPPIYTALAVLLIMTPHRRRGLMTIHVPPRQSQEDSQGK